MIFNRENIIHLNETGSTNDYAKMKAKEGAKDGTVIIADRQTQGKGRLGRRFHSSDAGGIYMSCIMRPDMDVSKVSRITLVAAVAAVRAIEKTSGVKCSIKWPNDIVCRKKKVAGILTEMSTWGEKVSFVVMGIGINVNNDSFPKEISDVATSIKIESGRSLKKTDVSDVFLEEFDACMEIFARTKDLSALKEEYEKALINTGREVKITGDDRDLTGICMGITNEGELIVKTKEGMQMIMSGEVSVRGVYGYV